MENRNGLAVNGCVTQAAAARSPSGHGDGGSDPGLASHYAGADKGYDSKNFVEELRTIRSPRTLRAKPLLSSMRGPLVIPLWLASKSVNASRRSSAGLKRSPAAQNAPSRTARGTGCFASHWPLITCQAAQPATASRENGRDSCAMRQRRAKPDAGRRANSAPFTGS